MMGFDRRRRALEADAFDDVWIKSALDEILDTFQFFGFGLEVLDELPTNDFSFLLRIRHAL
jgi:hypothetical protein